MARVNYIQVYNITIAGLVPAVELPIYGTIAVMRLMKMPDDDQHHLVVLTEKSKFCILRWSPSDMRCHTIMSGDMEEHFSSHRVTERIAIVEPNARCVALHLYPRLIKIVPTGRSSDRTSFNVRLPDDHVKSVVFLHGRSNPTLAVMLTSAGSSTNEMRTYEVSLSEQDLSIGGWSKKGLDVNCDTMIPVPQPWGGLLVFGDDIVHYLSPNGRDIFQPIDITVVSAVGRVDQEGKRYLFGDCKGVLRMLMLDTDDSGVCQLCIETLGETSSPTAISYLDNGFVYIGSQAADSQLIRLTTERNSQTGSFVEVVQSFPHLGPIVDFCVVQGMGYLRQGQGQVVTCSGMGKDGSLRVIRNGIGISEQASVDLPGIKSMFSLSAHVDAPYHQYLLQSFTSQTRTLKLVSDQEMCPATIPGFDERCTTLLARNMSSDILVQVTPNAVRVTDCRTMTASLTSPVWTPPKDVHISLACGNSTQVLLATTGGVLVYLEVDKEKRTLVEKGHRKMKYDISCVNCNYINTGSDMTDADNPHIDAKAFLAVVGLWTEVQENPVVKLIALPSLSTLQTVQLDGDVIARSALLCTMENTNYLLVALGDGCLQTYSLNAEAAKDAADNASGDVSDGEDAGTNDGMVRNSYVSDRRKLSIGTQPAHLTIFKSRGLDHVFASCDRPTVVYASTGGNKLLVSNVNLQELTYVCGFNTERFPDCLAIATTESLHLGAVDEIQKLHISDVPLGEQPRRIVHMDTARAFAVLTETSHINEQGEETVEHCVRTVDDIRYETISRFKLKPQECGMALITACFTGEGMDKREQFLVLGSGVEKAKDVIPESGRILIFRLIECRPHLVAELQVDGAIYSLHGYNGMLLATVGAEVRLISVSARKDGVINIKPEYSHIGHVLAYSIAVKGDFIVIGDVFRSTSVLTCKKIAGKYTLEQVARDFDATCVSALAMLDDEYYILGDHNYHLFTHKRNAYATSDADRGRLERIGQYHVGSRVNRIAPGSLVMQMTEMEGPALKTLIFGTADGTLGVIANIKSEAYDFFLRLQKAMETLIPGIGGLSHAEWREMRIIHPARAAGAKNYLDGDLIERFLDLNISQMTKVSSMLSIGVDKLVQRVEEMQRLHGAG